MRNTQDLRGDNIIDSRDLIARRDYLAEERADLASEAEDDTNDERAEARAALMEWDAGDSAEELRDIWAFLDEGTAEFQHGETLILDSYFEDYAQELADDVCEMPKDLRWPFTCIDWEKAAEELKQDYTYAELGSYTYWFRNC